MDAHVIAGLTTVVLCLVGDVFYIRDTLNGKTKPHMFTWIIWGIVMSLAAAVAFVEQAWVSSMTLGIEALVIFSVSMLAVRYTTVRLSGKDSANKSFEARG